MLLALQCIFLDNNIIPNTKYRVLQSDLVWTHKRPFSGLVGDLHLGNQKVTLEEAGTLCLVLF